MPTARLGALARLLLGRLLVVAAQLHLTEDTLALHLLLQGAQGLVDVVVANGNLHGLPTPFVSDLGTANGSQCPSPGIPGRRNSNTIAETAAPRQRTSDRKSTRLNSRHSCASRMPASA